MTKGKITHYSNIPALEVKAEGAKNAKIRWLIDKENDNAPVYSLRMIELEPGGFSPHHSHNWEHENFVVEGQGRLWLNDQWNEFKAGDVAFVPANTLHQFENTGTTTFKFLCGIPVEAIGK